MDKSKYSFISFSERLDYKRKKIFLKEGVCKYICLVFQLFHFPRGATRPIVSMLHRRDTGSAWKNP